jgi:uncharacterized protein with PIN domain
MVVDTSALVAIFLGEPERDQFVESILTCRESTSVIRDTG